MSSDVVKEVVVNATPETIFPYLVDSARLVEWMGTSATLDPVSGGEYRVLCGGVNPSAGTFLEVVKDEKVVFTFGWDLPGHPIPAGSTQVEITLTPTGDHTVVRLVHRGLPDDAVQDHGHGWDYYLARLTQVLDGQDPGPDRPDLGG